MDINLRLISLGLIFAFLLNSLGPIPAAQAQDFALPAPGIRVGLSPKFNPPILKGIKVHPDNPFHFDFILDKGESQLGNAQLKDESSKLIKYFLASLTIPEKDLWVNLSPYEKDRIVPESFGQTEMGRDLLVEDYMLKQITASLIYPEGEVGKRFWKRIYEEAAKKFGTTNIPVNTFNKVWIVPEKAVVYENAKSGTAYVVESKLKVMLEQDYLSLEKHEGVSVPPQVKDTNQLGSQIVREIVIPQLTKEVNEGKNFSQLRQVYNSLILATWYKKKIKESILVQVYENQNKIVGVNINDLQEKEKIYERYLQAFKKGAYNYIKEEINPLTQQPIPRKYFSGGVDAALIAPLLQVEHSVKSGDIANDHSMLVNAILKAASPFMMPKVDTRQRFSDRAMYSDAVIRNRMMQIDPVRFERMFKKWPLNKPDEERFKTLAHRLGMYETSVDQWIEEGKPTTKEQVGQAILREVAMSYLKRSSAIPYTELPALAKLQPWLQEAQHVAVQAYAMMKMYDFKMQYPMQWKAQLVEDLSNYFNRQLWNAKSDPLSGEFRDELDKKAEAFLTRYFKKNDVRGYNTRFVGLSTRLLRLTDEVYVGGEVIDGHNYIFLWKRPDGVFWNQWDKRPVLQDVADSELPPAYFVWISEAEAQKYKDIWNSMIEKPKKEEVQKEEGVADEYKEKETTIKELLGIDDEAARVADILKNLRGNVVHPDLMGGRLFNVLAPDRKVRLLPTINVPQIAHQPQVLQKEREIPYEERVNERWIKPMQALYITDEQGQHRPLSQQELAEKFRQAVRILSEERFKNNKHRPEFDQLMHRLAAALDSGNHQAVVQMRNDSPYFNDEFSRVARTINLPRIREEVRDRIEIAASIPKDDRIWVVTSPFVYQALRLWCDLNHIDQKIHIIAPISWETFGETHRVFTSAYAETYEKAKGPSSADWTAVHNDFLEWLHFSYRRDDKFKQEIDSLRRRLEAELAIKPGSNYRFIDNDINPFIFEFAIRTTKDPHIANPFSLNENGGNPDYFLNSSPVYSQVHMEFPPHRYGREIISPGGARYDGVFERDLEFYGLRFELYLLFMYNDVLAFMNEHKGPQGQMNPSLKPIDNTRFTIPTEEFTRPDDETAIKKMEFEPFMQMVENMPYEQWLKSRALILPRYSYFLFKKQLTEEKFWSHMIRLLRQEWERIYNKDKIEARENKEEGPISLDDMENREWPAIHWPDLDNDPEYNKVREIFKTVLDAAGPQFFTDQTLTDHFAEGFRLNPEDGKYYAIDKNDVYPRDSNKPFDFGSLWPGELAEEGPSIYRRFQPQFLDLMIEMYPQRVGPLFMDFLSQLMNHPPAMYKKKIEDYIHTFILDGSIYNALDAVQSILGQMERHDPEYFARLLLKSRLDPEALAFILDPNGHIDDDDYAKSRGELPEYDWIIPETILKAMVRLHEDEGNQPALIDAIAQEKPEFMDNYLLENWRTMPAGTVQRILHTLRISAQDLEKMEQLIEQEHFVSRPVALYLAQHPDVDINMLRILDPLMQGESTGYLNGWISAILSGRWSLDQVVEFMHLPLWKDVATHVRYEFSPIVEKMPFDQQEKMKVVLGGKALTRYKVNDLYPLNLPDEDIYVHQVHFKDMSRSTHFRGNEENDQYDRHVYNPLETEIGLQNRITDRARRILNNWKYFIEQPIEDLSHRIEVLQGFETEKSEMENQPYVLMLGIPDVEFERLFEILENNFESLKGLREVSKKAEGLMRQIISLNPDLKESDQDEIVAWAAKQLGVRQKELTGMDAQAIIRQQYLRQLRISGLYSIGVYNFLGRADLPEADQKQAMSLQASRDLLLEVVRHIAVYQHWLGKVKDPEPLLLTYNPARDTAMNTPVPNGRDSFRFHSFLNVNGYFRNRIVKVTYPDQKIVWGIFVEDDFVEKSDGIHRGIALERPDGRKEIYTTLDDENTIVHIFRNYRDALANGAPSDWKGLTEPSSDFAMNSDAAMITPEMRSTKTILVVDDSQDHREINVSALKEAGYKFIITNNGKEGLGLLKSQHIDGVILDEEMGGDGIIRKEMRRIWKARSKQDGFPPGEKGFDGSEMLEAMRQDQSLKDIPVVFRTSTVDAYEVDSSFFPNAKRFLLKIGAQGVFGKETPLNIIIEKIDFLLFPGDAAMKAYDGPPRRLTVEMARDTFTSDLKSLVRFYGPFVDLLKGAIENLKTVDEDQFKSLWLPKIEKGARQIHKIEEDVENLAILLGFAEEDTQRTVEKFVNKISEEFKVDKVIIEFGGFNGAAYSFGFSERELKIYNQATHDIYMLSKYGPKTESGQNARKALRKMGVKSFVELRAIGSGVFLGRSPSLTNQEGALKADNIPFIEGKLTDDPEFGEKFVSEVIQVLKEKGYMDFGYFMGMFRHNSMVEMPASVQEDLKDVRNPQGTLGRSKEGVIHYLNNLVETLENAKPETESFIELLEKGANYQVMDIAPLIREKVESYRNIIERKGLKLEIDFDKGPLMAQSIDPNYLRLVIENLIENAVKYTDKGTIKVRLYQGSFKSGRNERQGILFKIEDTGIGIPEKDMDEIFSIGVRASNVGKRPGTGRGLNIVERAVHAMHGDIDMSSKGGEGTVFTVRFRPADNAQLIISKKWGPGGIDLTSDKALTVQNNGQGIKFHIDPAMLQQLQNAPGFVPVIISIQPMNNLRQFLGLNDNEPADVISRV